MTSNRKQFTVTREMLTAVARQLSITRLFVFHRFDPFALSCFAISLGEQLILFSSNLNVSLDFVSGNIEILGKQNSLFPSGPVIKCLLLTSSLKVARTWKIGQPASFSESLFSPPERGCWVAPVFWREIA